MDSKTSIIVAFVHARKVGTSPLLSVRRMFRARELARENGFRGPTLVRFYRSGGNCY